MGGTGKLDARPFASFAGLWPIEPDTCEQQGPLSNFVGSLFKGIAKLRGNDCRWFYGFEGVHPVFQSQTIAEHIPEPRTFRKRTGKFRRGRLLEEV